MDVEIVPSDPLQIQDRQVGKLGKVCEVNERVGGELKSLERQRSYRSKCSWCVYLEPNELTQVNAKRQVIRRDPSKIEQDGLIFENCLLR